MYINNKSKLDFHKKHKKISTVTAVHPPGRFGNLDIKGKSLHTFSYITGNIKEKNLDKTTTWILPILNSNKFLVGTKDGVE